MAPAVSTLPKSIRDAYEAVSKEPNGLLGADPNALTRFRFFCPELSDGTAATPIANPKGTVRGVWRETAGTKLTIPLIGVVDAANSKIGAYGNLDKSNTPTFKKLKGCKFIVALTYPEFKDGHPDVAFAEGIVNQMACISQMQKDVNSRVEPAIRNNNAVRFTESAGDYKGSIVTTLGLVYIPAVQEASFEDFLKRSPTKKQESKADAAPPNIVCDPNFFTAIVPGAKAFKHNDQLPIFFTDGGRVGRTGEELSRELTDGRWVRVDCELVVWNITEDAGAVRTFQLAVERMVVLPRIPSAGHIGPDTAVAPLSAKAYITCPPSDDDQAGKGKQAAGGKDKASASDVTQAEDSKQDSDDSTGTVSSGGTVPVKRGNATESESAAKKLKQ